MSEVQKIIWVDPEFGVIDKALTTPDDIMYIRYDEYEKLKEENRMQKATIGHYQEADRLNQESIAIIKANNEKLLKEIKLIIKELKSLQK